MSNDTPAPSPLPPMLQAGENKPKVLTTENIQELLDENAKIIKAIVDCQNAGKLDSCAKYQKQLAQNLNYLAAVADAQNPDRAGHAPTVASQATPQT